MFHVIIVDDEQTIRDGICRHIHRTFPQLVVDGVFADGKNAIDFMKKNHVDIVITDIKMSEKSGIDVAQYLYENSTDTKIIFLSGYQEFEYAKQAIQYNVKYYLSKPVKLKELNNALTELYEQLLVEQRKNNEQEKEKQYLRSLLSMVKRNFYSDILLGILNQKEAILQRAEKIGLTEEFLTQTQCAIFSIIVLNKHVWHYCCDDLYTYLLNLLREVTGISSLIPIIQEKHKIIYIGEFNCFSSGSALRQSLSVDLMTMAQNAQELLGIEIQHELLLCGDNIFSLTEYYNPAMNSDTNPALLEDKYKDLLARILAHDSQGAHEILQALLIYARPLSLHDSRAILSRLFQKITNNLSDASHIPIDLHFTECANQEELFKQGTETLDAILSYTAGSGQDVENETIARAKAYIHEHYAEDIGLEDVAGFVYLNPVYFSRFFKQHTDVTMTEYLTHLRINRASELLLKHRYKIHEISKACGYKSSKYFSKVFKLYTGLAPSEFVKNNRK